MFKAADYAVACYNRVAVASAKNERARAATVRWIEMTSSKAAIWFSQQVDKFGESVRATPCFTEPRNNAFAIAKLLGSARVGALAVHRSAPISSVQVR
ncbi:MAG TPA: hypothetical protein VGH81_02440 [Rudaea sp.]|jgi:hypothetical protein